MTDRDQLHWSRWKCTLSLQEIHEEVRKMNPGWDDPESDGYKASVVMFAALKVGQDTSRLSSFTGYSEEFIVTIEQRLRLAMLWDEGDRFNIDHWFDEHDRDFGFFIDSLVRLERLGAFQMAELTWEISS